MARAAAPRAGVANDWQQWPDANVGGQAARKRREAWAVHLAWKRVVGASEAPQPKVS